MDGKLEILNLEFEYINVS